MADNVYEGMFILDSNRYGHDPDAISGQVNETIQKLGGEILVSRLWEERRLAYPIKAHRKGTYWLTYFRLAAEQLTTLKREFRINENVLRTLLLKVDPRIVNALVAHAQTAPVGAPLAVEETPPPAAVVVGVDPAELEVPDLDEIE